MRKKLMVGLLIFTMLVTGCGTNDNSSTLDDNEVIATNSSEVEANSENSDNETESGVEIKPIENIANLAHGTALTVIKERPEKAGIITYGKIDNTAKEREITEEEKAEIKFEYMGMNVDRAVYKVTNPTDFELTIHSNFFDTLYAHTCKYIEVEDSYELKDWELSYTFDDYSTCQIVDYTVSDITEYKQASMVELTAKAPKGYENALLEYHYNLCVYNEDGSVETVYSQTQFASGAEISFKSLFTNGGVRCTVVGYCEVVRDKYFDITTKDDVLNVISDVDVDAYVFKCEPLYYDHPAENQLGLYIKANSDIHARGVVILKFKNGSMAIDYSNSCFKMKAGEVDIDALTYTTRFYENASSFIDEISEAYIFFEPCDNEDLSLCNYDGIYKSADKITYNVENSDISDDSTNNVVNYIPIEITATHSNIPETEDGEIKYIIFYKDKDDEIIGLYGLKEVVDKNYEDCDYSTTIMGTYCKEIMDIAINISGGK